MQPEVNVKSASLYETDFQRWIDQTVEQLRAHDFSHIDLENLIEEIESLGRSEKRAISSYLMRLCEHILKLQYWELERERCFRGWRLEIANFRLDIHAMLDDSPSLRNYLDEKFVIEYTRARKLFLKASELNANLISEEPDFTLEQALDEDWLPWQPQ